MWIPAAQYLKEAEKTDHHSQKVSGIFITHDIPKGTRYISISIFQYNQYTPYITLFLIASCHIHFSQLQLTWCLAKNFLGDFYVHNLKFAILRNLDTFAAWLGHDVNCCEHYYIQYSWFNNLHITSANTCNSFPWCHILRNYNYIKQFRNYTE